MINKKKKNNNIARFEHITKEIKIKKCFSRENCYLYYSRDNAGAFECCDAAFFSPPNFGGWPALPQKKNKNTTLDLPHHYVESYKSGSGR